MTRQPVPGKHEPSTPAGLNCWPCREGEFFASPHDSVIGHALVRYGEYSPDEVRLLTTLCQPGDTVVEAGAYIGALSVPLARRLGPSGRLHCFEPQPDACQVLVANLARNGLAQVTVHAAGLGATAGEWRVPTIDWRVEGNHGDTALNRSGAGRCAPVTTIDALALPACRLIKADVQGMERALVEGARETIARHRPWLYIENDRREGSRPLLTALFDLGYQVWWHLPPLYRADNFRGAPLDRLADVVSINLLCAPPGATPPPADLFPVTDPDQWWKDLPASCPPETGSTMNDTDDALFHLAARQFGRARLDDARALLDAILERQPDRVDALYLLAEVHETADRDTAAIACLRRLLEVMPGDREVSLWLSGLLERAKLTEAALAVVASADTDPAGDPELALAHACLLDQLGRVEPAVARIDAALAASPGHPGLRFRRAMILLGQGRLSEGWPDYTARTELDPAFARPAGAALWHGEPLAGRRLLIVAEGGHGDAIWAARFIEATCRQDGDVFLQMRPALATLLADLRGLSGTVSLDADPAEFDLYVPLLDLPGCLGVSDAADWPPASLVARALPEERLPALLARARGRLRVGIHWAGSESYGNQHHRAATLDDFLPLLAVPGVQLYSLQKGPEQAVLRDTGVGNLIIDCDDDDFSETAALVRELDLVIMTDSALAHLTGSLGVPIWNLLDICPYWMFGRSGDTTPWYPSMRLFRQQRAGDWRGVMDALSAALAQRVARNGGAG